MRGNVLNEPGRPRRIHEQVSEVKLAVVCVLFTLAMQGFHGLFDIPRIGVLGISVSTLLLAAFFSILMILLEKGRLGCLLRRK